MTRVRASRILGTLAGLSAVAVVQGQDQPDGTGLEELRATRDFLVQASDFSAALEPAERIVEQLTDTEDPMLGDDLLRLARIQASLQEYATAEDTYLDAIDRLREDRGQNSPTLIDAFRGLGRAYMNDRRFEEALIAFDEARTTSRRIDGLFNIEQTEIIDDLTLAHLGTGNTMDARDLQYERLENARRLYGEDDARMIPFHRHLGDYLDNSRLRVGAREQYELALDLSERNYGSESAESLDLLRRMAEIDLLLDQDGEVHQRIESALQANPDLHPLSRAAALVTLADHRLVYEGLDAAQPLYRQAYELLSGTDEADPAQIFSSPRPLNLVPPLSPVDRGTRTLPWSWGELTLEFDVSAAGRASNVALVEMNPQDEDVADDYIRRIREAYFRPRLVDGTAAGTAQMRYNQGFRYYVREGRRRRNRGD